MFQFIFRRTNINNKLQNCFLQIYGRTKHNYSTTQLTPEQEKILSEILPKPKPSSCCGNGCTDCALVHYFEELEEYERQKRDLVIKLFHKIPSKMDIENPLLQQYNTTSSESQLSKK